MSNVKTVTKAAVDCSGFDNERDKLQRDAYENSGAGSNPAGAGNRIGRGRFCCARKGGMKE
jgi:hypothetical protein